MAYVNNVIEKLQQSSEGEFSSQILTLSEIIQRSNGEICPKLGVRTEFCEIVMGNMTPILFPWLFPQLDHAIYIDRKMVFQVRTLTLLLEFTVTKTAGFIKNSVHAM